MSDTPSKIYAERTIAAYRLKADEAIQNWSRFKRRSRLLRQFAQALSPGAHVLDYGCGIGADMTWLKARGFQVEGLDGVLEFVEEARKRCPGARVAHVRFERVELPLARYDGIWSNAALIHVPAEEMGRQLSKLKRALKPGGLLGMTLAWGSASGFVEQDWIPGRYIVSYSKDKAVWFFRDWKVRWLKTVSNEGRKGRWIQILAYNK